MTHVKTVQLMFSGEFEILNSQRQCEQLLDAIVVTIGLTKLQSIHHHFKPQGVSVVQLLAESHIAIHTWPEKKQGYITITSCKFDALNEKTITEILSQNNLQLTELLQVSGSATS